MIEFPSHNIMTARRLGSVLAQDGKGILFALLCECKLLQIFLERKCFPGQMLNARCHGLCCLAIVKVPQFGVLVVIGITA